VNKVFKYAHKIRDVLVREGFSEVMTYSFQSEGTVEVANPIATDKNFLRPSLEPGLRASLEHNMRYKDLLGLESIKIFEIGTVFDSDEEHIALGIAASEDNSVASAFKRIARELGVELEVDARDGFGEVDISRLVEDLSEPTFDVEHIDTSAVVYQPFSLYPFVLRDIAVWVPNGTGDAETVLEVIKKTASELLVQHTIFDEYAKDDRTSYAFHLVFQSFEKTLSDDEVNTVMAHIERVIVERGWEVR
jgi:phenylalanyl-tRNA synthetase beta subunit